MRILILGVAICLSLLTGLTCCEIVDAGEVGVVTVFGEVNDSPLPPGIHWIHPLSGIEDYNTKDQILLAEDIAIIPQDDLRSVADITLSYRIKGALAPLIKKSTGTQDQLVSVLLEPRFRSAIRQATKTVESTEMLTEVEGQRRIQDGITELLLPLQEQGIEVTAVLMRDLRRPEVIERSAQAKVERQQAAQRQEQELKRVETEAQERVVKAKADMQAAEMQAKQQRLMADAKAYEISTVAKAIGDNPGYLKLETLKTLGQMAFDPSAKFYFMDPSQSTPAIPFLNIEK